MTHDRCGVRRGSADVDRRVYAHSHTTMCTPWCKCLQLTTMQIQTGEAGTDDAGVPVAPSIQYVSNYVSIYSESATISLMRRIHKA